jgi:hypothetical protein
MRLKSIGTLIGVIGLGSVLAVSGCHHGGGSAAVSEGDSTSQNVAPSDVSVDAKSGAASKSGARPAEPAGADAAKTETNSIVDTNTSADLPEREEIRRSYSLKPNASVVISGLNGRVDVETADTDHAEILIVRSAKKREDLQYRKINIERDQNELRIRVEQDRRSIFSAFGSRPEGRQRLMLKLPRKVQFETDGVNGNVTVGEIDGPVQVRGVNGAVNIAQAVGEASFRGVNGKIDATLAKLSGDGVQLTGVNGNTTLHFIGEVNADVEARGQNGKVNSDLPNLEERKDERRHNGYNARIGTGGPQIEIRGVNGNVYLTKAEKPAAAAAKVAAK